MSADILFFRGHKPGNEVFRCKKQGLVCAVKQVIPANNKRSDISCIFKLGLCHDTAVFIKPAKLISAVPAGVAIYIFAVAEITDKVRYIGFSDGIIFQIDYEHCFAVIVIVAKGAVIQHFLQFPLPFLLVLRWEFRDRVEPELPVMHIRAFGVKQMYVLRYSPGNVEFAVKPVKIIVGIVVRIEAVIFAVIAKRIKAVGDLLFIHPLSVFVYDKCVEVCVFRSFVIADDSGMRVVDNREIIEIFPFLRIYRGEVDVLHILFGNKAAELHIFCSVAAARQQHERGANSADCGFLCSFHSFSPTLYFWLSSEAHLFQAVRQADNSSCHRTTAKCFSCCDVSDNNDRPLRRL